MHFDLKTVNSILGINESFKAPEKMMQLMLNPNKRNETFKKFLEVSTDMSFDWFHEYFEDEQAERKSKKQDFTPDSVALLMNRLTGGSKNGYYYEPAAGTGGILITRWWQDRIDDPVHLSKLKSKNTGLSLFTYDPRLYWYQVEEMSDRAIPFLLFNMAIRGMNGAVVQCNSLERKAKDVYFVRNDSSNYLAFGEIHKMPHTDELKKMYGINEWVDELE